MGQSYESCENISQENITHFNYYTPFAQVHSDYYGCLPEDSDPADLVRTGRIRAIKVS